MNAQAPPLIQIATPGYGAERAWHARIELEFAARADKTVLNELRFSGPLRVQRPFYPEGSPCQVYLLHPPGGMVSGDRLEIDIKVLPGAHALLTTPSAGKIYQADSAGVQQTQAIRVLVEQGICEWLPQENILFNGANACLQTEVYLTGAATFIGWELLGFGRPQGQQPFVSGQLRQSFAIFNNGVPLVLEKLRLDPQLSLLKSNVGLMGFPYMGNFFIVTEQPGALCEQLRALLPAPNAQQLFAVTSKPPLVIVRGLSHCAEQLRSQFIQLWQTVREVVLMRPASLPRIWST